MGAAARSARTRAAAARRAGPRAARRVPRGPALPRAQTRAGRVRRWRNAGRMRMGARIRARSGGSAAAAGGGAGPLGRALPRGAWREVQALHDGACGAGANAAHHLPMRCVSCRFFPCVRLDRRWALPQGMCFTRSVCRKGRASLACWPTARRCPRCRSAPRPGVLSRERPRACSTPHAPDTRDTRSLKRFTCRPCAGACRAAARPARSCRARWPRCPRRRPPSRAWARRTASPRRRRHPPLPSSP